MLSIVYLISDIGVGLVANFWIFSEGILANYLCKHYAYDEDFGGVNFFQLNLIFQGICWISQFIGHGVFEKRAPAILTNLFFAYYAPFFETFLIMNKVFGYKEGPRMQKIY